MFSELSSALPVTVPLTQGPLTPPSTIMAEDTTVSSSTSSLSPICMPLMSENDFNNFLLQYRFDLPEENSSSLCSEPNDPLSTSRLNEGQQMTDIFESPHYSHVDPAMIVRCNTGTDDNIAAQAVAAILSQSLPEASGTTDGAQQDNETSGEELPPSLHGPPPPSIPIELTFRNGEVVERGIDINAEELSEDDEPDEPTQSEGQPVDRHSSSRRRISKKKNSLVWMTNDRARTRSHSKRTTTILNRVMELNTVTGPHILLYVSRPESICSSNGSASMFISAGLRNAVGDQFVRNLHLTAMEYTRKCHYDTGSVLGKNLEVQRAREAKVEAEAAKARAERECEEAMKAKEKAERDTTELRARLSLLESRLAYNNPPSTSSTDTL